ncbi:MAG: type II toxin-antitoxin system prevent-host-death family antitoxin [Propionibacteriaceae bacterium]|jgi:prevent-host-death family protein|nr:type II toxin-antitoxin system prevent-host-death family antitoxin [Propionibacteriaceae bacterium]
MSAITQRDLKMSTAAIMDRVEAGEAFEVTRSGYSVARLIPIAGPKRSVRRKDLARALAGIPDMVGDPKAEADEFFGDGGDRVG